jgi:hypothetical protein
LAWPARPTPARCRPSNAGRIVRFDLETKVVALASSAAVFVNGDWFGAAGQAAVIGLLLALRAAAIVPAMLEGEQAAGPG